MGDAAQDARQELMDIYRELPERQDVVDVVRGGTFLTLTEGRKLFRHTGKNLIKRLKSAPELAAQVCLALRLGMSARACALRFNMSPNSVVAVREALRERGELEAVSKRVDAILDDFIELAAERIKEGILMGEIHPGQLPIPLMAAIDKRSQRDAGVVLGTGRTEGELVASELEAKWAAAKALLDLQSKAGAAQVVDVQVQDVAEAGADTLAGNSNAGFEVSSNGGTTADQVPGAAAAEGGEAGGGGSDSGARQDGRWAGPENFGS